MNRETAEPVRLEQMTWDDFDAWSEHSVRGFADQQVAAGLQPEVEATAYARRQFADLLPDGLATPLHLLWTVLSADPDASLVGYLWLRVRTLSSEVEAFVFDIEVLEEARGRGLGRATMLVAERVARELDATVIRLNVFGHNTAAIGLYESLGYLVTNATMTKRLDTSPTSAAGPEHLVELRGMTLQEYAAFRPRLEADYAANLARSGAMATAEATRKSAEDLARLLPDGLASAGHRLWTAYNGGEAVGLLWLQLQERSDGLHAFGFEFEVRADLRRRGYGRSVMAAAERVCRDLGVTSVALSVFGFNSGARELYRQSGFVVTAQTMAKQV